MGPSGKDACLLAGICILEGESQGHLLAQRLEQLQIAQWVQHERLATGTGVRYFLTPQARQVLTPDCDTTGLCRALHWHPETNAADLEREILLALLASPMSFDFPLFADFMSAVRVRIGTVQAARNTALAFDTSSAAERPEGYWTYARDTGFVTLDGVSLIDALRKASQPEVSGRLYAFSCYRATEYVLLLAVAEELARTQPEQLARLERQWRTQAIASGLFHDTFLVEYGSMDAPLPPLYYVPGDRVWFRNPDEASSDASGFEGSWVFYLGCGLFSNFWVRDAPFTLESKCLEVYHWRHGTYVDEEGDLRMDEDRVAQCVQQTLRDPAARAQIVAQMMRLREPKGVYRDGGCIDTSRECVRPIGPSAPPLVLPDA